MPTIAMKDRKSKWIVAEVVPNKGECPYAARRIARNLRQLGYKMIYWKSGQEPSILALRNQVRMEVAQDIEIVNEETPVGDSKSNADAESGVKQCEGMFRTVKGALEGRYGKKLWEECETVPWLVRHATLAMSRYRVGTDGKTAYERLKMRKFNRTVCEFGECGWQALIHI
mgnify:CR=1 FL=1